MEMTLSANYPVLKQDKGVLLNTFEKHHSQKIQHCTSMTEAFTDVFNNTSLFCLSTG